MAKRSWLLGFLIGFGRASSKGGGSCAGWPDWAQGQGNLGMLEEPDPPMPLIIIHAM